MDLTLRSYLSELSQIAESSGVSLYVFGSVSRGDPHPRDVDIFLLYDNSGGVESFRRKADAAASLLPLDLTAMSRDEELHYDFLRVTNAIPLEVFLSESPSN